MVNRNSNELIQEFWYNTAGSVYSASRLSDVDEKWKYARVISLDSFQLELGKELLNSCLTVAGLVAQLDFVMELRKTGDSTQRETLRVLYTAVFSIGITCQCLMVLLNTWQQMRSSRFRADAWLGSTCESLTSSLKIFVLNFFGVVHTVKTMPIMLHPRKGVQPFVAFKAKGLRMFALGWPSKIMYDWERDRGKKTGHLRVACCALPLFLLQVVLGHGLGKMGGMEFLCGFLTFCSAAKALSSFVKIKCDEARAKEYLRSMTDAKLDDAAALQHLKSDREAKIELIVNYRLREEYFGDALPEKVLQWARRENLAGTAHAQEAESLCGPCDWGDDEDDEEFKDGGGDSSDSDFSESALCIHSKRYVYRR